MLFVDLTYLAPKLHRGLVECLFLKDLTHLPLTVSIYTETLFKMMKNVFYFISKALFVVRIFKFFVVTFW